MAQPKVSYLVDSQEWELEEDFLFADFGLHLTIHKGFRFDLASIPRLLWRLIAPFELSITAPLVHDYLYRCGGRLPGGAILEREDADQLFLQIMEAAGVSWWRRRAAYRAVRIFGSRAWKEPKACIPAA